jgi:hypothetical protein
MTTTTGWPGKPGVPLNPEKDGWHWVEIIHGISKPRPRLWWSKIDRWKLSDKALISPSEFAERWRYLAPCLTPDQATALQARIAELEGAQGRLILSFRLNLLRLNPRLSHETISKAIEVALTGGKDE